MSEVYPYGTLREVGPGLYCLDGRWGQSPLGRRMTVIRNAAGELAIHSAIRLSDDDYPRTIDALGRVALILVPSSLHDDEARFYAERYPRAKVYVPAPVRERCAAKLPRVDATYSALLPEAWSNELVALQLEGTKMGEALFWHVPSRTLIATDLVFHFTRNSLSGFQRAFMKWNRVLERIGPSRIFCWFFLSDKAALVRSLQPVKSWDFERIVMSHGTILEQDGKRRFLEGFATLGV